MNRPQTLNVTFRNVACKACEAKVGELCHKINYWDKELIDAKAHHKRRATHIFGLRMKQREKNARKKITEMPCFVCNNAAWRIGMFKNIEFVYCPACWEFAGGGKVPAWMRGFIEHRQR